MGSMSNKSHLPIAIYYEQPNWFKPLFAELDRREINYIKLNAVDHTYSPEDRLEEEYALVFNRMSPSAWNRNHGDQIFYTLGFLEHLEGRGVRVINGLKAFRSVAIAVEPPGGRDGTFCLTGNFNGEQWHATTEEKCLVQFPCIIDSD
jgi:hypothetical protein